jgi:gliding motility-associated lipoprotein GldH
MAAKPAKTIAATLVILSTLAAFSCSDKIVSNSYRPIENSSWSRSDEYYFTFMINDASIPYNIIVEIRNNDAYPYRNLWIFASEESPVGLVRRDTIQCTLADNRDRWTGQGFSIRESGFPIRARYYFPIKGRYTFGIKQGMRGDAIRGIREIGLRLEKAD